MSNHPIDLLGNMLGAAWRSQTNRPVHWSTTIVWPDLTFFASWERRGALVLDIVTYYSAPLISFLSWDLLMAAGKDNERCVLYK